MSEAVEPTSRASAEPIPVQLTRMEGVLNLVAFQVADHGKRLDRAETNIDALNLVTQRLGDDAQASRATALSLAKALKEADEARRDKSTAAWSPFQRVAIAISTLTALVALAVAFLK
ncbi:MAG: hypothetical protein Q7V58_09415 [Actinomycetota bacterium]|nr:hypothetical protein [Actinomycetota bacterium]